jgi:hypothetical protein
MNKLAEVEKYLRKYGEITSLEIMQMFYSTCPHAIIRDLREKFGADSITDEWQNKTNIIEREGKKIKQTIKWKKYIWKGAA